MTATARRLRGDRLHLQHGPIELVIGADGDRRQVESAYRAASAAFPAILPRLVEELAILRTGVDGSVGPPEVEGPVARRMSVAVWPYRDRFVTPMAAVAGSVADHVLAVMRATADLRRIYVNNGGDVAIHLAPGSSFEAGVVGDVGRPAVDARIALRAGDGVGGLATSGWRGRSQSLGIADAVTVLAPTAAAADAAATMIANAVDVDHPTVHRRPATDVKLDSDLGDLPVTVAVGRLPDDARRAALARGLARAREILGQRLAIAAYIQLQGEIVVAGARAPAVEAA